MTELQKRAMVVAQLVERLLPIPEIHSSNPVIGKFYLLFMYWKDKTKAKIGREWHIKIFTYLHFLSAKTQLLFLLVVVQDDVSISERLSARPACPHLRHGQQGLPRHDPRRKKSKICHFRWIWRRKNGHRKLGNVLQDLSFIQIHSNHNLWLHWCIWVPLEE